MSTELDDLTGPDAAAVLAGLRAAGPVTRLAAIDGWLVTGYDAAVAVMRDHERFTVDDPRFSTAQVVGPSMLSVDGSEHRRHRVPFGAAFRPARVEATFTAPARQLAADLVDRIRPAQSAELRTTVAGPLAVGVMIESLGLDGVDAATMLGWYRSIVEAVSTISAGGQPAAAAATAVAELAGHIRSGLSRDSVLGSAIGGLDEAEIIANAAVMMFGGIETVEGMILNAALHLLADPVALAEVRRERALLPAAVEESLRLDPAAAAVDRYATEDVVLAGSPVRRGDLVRVSLAAANRDPGVFAEPDRFALRRPNVGDHLAFARGPHVCIAADLARLETRIALDVLLDLPGLRLAAPAAPTGLIFRKPLALQVCWD